MTDGKKSLFHQPVKSHRRTYDNNQKIETGQGDDYTTGCWLKYNYFIKHYKIIPIDLSKKLAVDDGLKAIQQINFMENLDRDEGEKMFFFIEGVKGTILDFLHKTVTVLQF